MEILNNKINKQKIKTRTPPSSLSLVIIPPEGGSVALNLLYKLFGFEWFDQEIGHASLNASLAITWCGIGGQSDDGNHTTSLPNTLTRLNTTHFGHVHVHQDHIPSIGRVL